MSETAKKARVATSIDIDAGVVTLGGAAFRLDDLPQAAVRALALRGMRDVLRLADDAGVEYVALKAGSVFVRPARVAKPLSPIKAAIAQALANEQAQALKVSNLDKVRRAELLAEAKDTVATMDKAKVAAMKSHASVLAVLAQLGKANAGPSLMNMAGIEPVAVAEAA